MAVVERGSGPLVAPLLAAMVLAAPGPASAGPAGVVHRVKSGTETYADIAEHYYGHRYLGHHLRVVNRQPEPLRKGRTLVVPTSREVPLASGQSLEAFAKKHLGRANRGAYLELLHFLKSKRARAGKRLTVPASLRHVVRPSESLASIARTYYRDASRRRLGLLRAYNGRTSNTLRVGEVLRIPLDTQAFAHAAVERRRKRPFGTPPPPPPPTAAAPVRAKAPSTSAAPARLSRQEARQEVERAERLYADGRYAQCLEYAKGVLQRYDTRLPKGPKVELLRLAGAALVALDRISEAESTFVQLLAIDSSYELDLYRTSPKILDVFDSAR